MSKTHALIKFDDGEFGVVMASDIFKEDPDDELSIGSRYRIQWYDSALWGLLKYCGNEQATDLEFRKISSYEKIEKNPKLPQNSKTPSKPSIPLSEPSTPPATAHEHAFVLRQLEKRNMHIASLREEIKVKDEQLAKLAGELDAYRQVQDKAFFQNVLHVCTNVVKYLATDEDLDELRSLVYTQRKQKVLISDRFPGLFMSTALLENVLVMLRLKESNTNIMRKMFKVVVPKNEEWAVHNAQYMREHHNILYACKGIVLREIFGNLK